MQRLGSKERVRHSAVYAALLAGAVLVNTIVALSPRFFPYGDTENHLARYVLIAKAWHHAAPPWVQFRWVPTAYIAIDSLGAALATFFSPVCSLRILVAAYAVLLPAAFYLLFRAVDRHGSRWALVACLLTFNWYFLTGFLSFVIGTAAAFLWLAWWWPRRTSTSALQVAAGGIGIAVLYLIHMSSATTVAAVLGSWCIEPIIVSRGFEADALRAAVKRALVVVAYLLPTLALHVIMNAANVLPTPASDALVFRDSADKFRHFLTPFASFSRMEAAGLAACYAIALTVRLAQRSQRLANPVWVTAVAVLLIAYLAFPLVAFGAWDVDVRFLLPAYLLVFLAIPTEQGTPARSWGVVFLFVATVLHAIVVAEYTRQIDARLTDLIVLGRDAPTNAHVLALTAEDDDFFRIDPFTHAAERLVADDPSVRVSGLFTGGQNGAYLGHFIISEPLYDPGIHWARKGFPRLDWHRVRHDYSNILLEGDDGVAAARVSEGAVRVATRGDAALYVVR